MSRSCPWHQARTTHNRPSVPPSFDKWQDPSPFCYFQPCLTGFSSAFVDRTARSAGNLRRTREGCNRPFVPGCLITDGASLRGRQWVGPPETADLLFFGELRIEWRRNRGEHSDPPRVCIRRIPQLHTLVLGAGPGWDRL